MKQTFYVLRLCLATSFKAAPAMTLAMSAVVLCSAVLAPLVALGVKLIVDGATTGADTSVGVVVLAVSTATVMLTRSFGAPMAETLSEKVYLHVEADLLRLVSTIPSLAHHEDGKLADQISLLEKQRRRLSSVGQLLGTLSAAVSLFTVIALLASVHGILILLVLLACVVALMDARGKQAQRRLISRHEHLRRLGSAILDSLETPGPGLEIRCYGLASVLLRAASATMMLRFWRFRRVTMVAAGRTSIAWLLFLLAYFGALVWLAGRLLSGEALAGDLLLLILLAPQMTGAAGTIVSNSRIVADSFETFDRYHWLKCYALRHNWSASRRLPPDRLISGIRFVDVTFDYPASSDCDATQERPVNSALQDLNLHFTPGMTVALVGDNGGGKSTLVKLLARFYDPTSGDILVDGVPLSQLDPHEWRARLSAGFQDFVRWEFTVGESIGIGALENLHDGRRIRAAAGAAYAQDFIGQLPGGLSCQLGASFEEGVGLSGGQWQRLSLARAFMRDQPLLMLLDEPAASLDPESEHAIYEQYAKRAATMRERNGGITFIVSHRFSTARLADLILVFKDGRVIEQGNHDQLVSTNGRYAELFKMQASSYQ